MGDKYRILVIGNNAAESSQLFEKLQLSYPGNNCIEMEQARLEFYAYPDLNLFNRFQEPQLDDSIRQLIGDTTDGGGVSLFLILISQTEIFSNNMKEMLIEIPQNIYFRSESYFWNHAAILFSFEDNETNYREEMSNSINRNSGIREVVNMVGGRYTWMSNSDSKEEIQGRIQSLCNEIGKAPITRKKLRGDQEIETPILRRHSSASSSRLKTVSIFILLIIAFTFLYQFHNFENAVPIENISSQRKAAIIASTEDNYTSSPETESGIDLRDPNANVRIIKQLDMDDEYIRNIQAQQLRGDMGSLLQADNERCAFVNRTSSDGNFGTNTGNEQFKLFQCTLTLSFYTKSNLTSPYLQVYKVVGGGGKGEDKFYFHINLLWHDEYNENLESQMKDAIQTMISLGEGASGMVVLISLVIPFKELVLSLTGCYIPEHYRSFEFLVESWWKQTLIVFKVVYEIDTESFVQSITERTSQIKSKVGKMSDRSTWVAEVTTLRECKDRMTEMCLALRKELNGRCFIKSFVVKKI